MIKYDSPHSCAIQYSTESLILFFKHKLTKKVPFLLYTFFFPVLQLSKHLIHTVSFWPLKTHLELSQSALSTSPS